MQSGMTNVALAAAAITLSDNTAINLLMKEVEGEDIRKLFNMYSKKVLVDAGS